MEISPAPTTMTVSKTKQNKTTNVTKHKEKFGALCPTNGNVKWGSCYRIQDCSSSKY